MARGWRWIAVVAGIAGLVALTLVALARADGTPNISASVSSSVTLYGDPVEVTVSAQNPQGQPYGYNLSYRVVLPAGVSYGGGGPTGPKEILDAPAPGQTTLIFSNVSDLSPGATKAFTFQADYDKAVYDAGDSFPVVAQAFVNSNPRFVPKFSAQGVPAGPATKSFTGYTPEVSGTQALKALEVEIDEPSPEGEILRGVHEHQTVYTLKVTNNRVNPTTGTKLNAYVPAGLEFLGCGGPGADNTTDAPTNPGSADEYPGSGPIVVNPLTDCVEPESVETELVDPDGPGPMPEAIYTHVVWPIGALASGETRTFPYRAAVPIRANTNSFTGPRPSAASGDQATNLDNNSGPEVVDETQLRTYAVASGDYQGKTSLAASDGETLNRTAEDWVVRKSADSDVLAQGQITTWTLTFETSEYKYVEDAVVTDTLPDGLCPLGPSNMTGNTDPSDPECDPVDGQEPSAPYALTTENPDGTWTLSWDPGSLAKLGHIGVSDKFTITFPSKTRTHYQENHEPAGPILANDRIENEVSTEGAGWARCTAPGTPDCSTPGPKIYFQGTDGSTIVDASQAGQIAGAPAILKEVAVSGTDCQTATYTDEVPVYHPGDRICWRLRIDFPGTLDTSPQALADFLPEGTTYVPGSDQAGPENNVLATIDESAAAEDRVLSWTVTGSTVPAGGEVFEHFIATIAQPTGMVKADDLNGNLFKLSSENTAGESFPQRAEAEYALATPLVGLTKGVEEIVRDGSTVEGPNGPNADNKTVEASDEVTYRVDVGNSGAQDAIDVEVWDRLPSEYQCPAVAAISDGGECVDDGASDRIVWSGLSVNAGASKKLTYTATVPSDIGPGRNLVNNAGVVEFAGEANTGALYVYTPAENIDPTREEFANAAAADDPSNVRTSGATIAKTQTTEITEGGNNAATQATIGEKVKYTLTATVPEGTTLGGSAAITDTVSSTTRFTYVPGTATATLNGSPLPGGFVLDTSGATPKLTFPADYANAPGSGNDLVVLSFEMVVADVAGNSRTAANVTNQAALQWTDPDAGAQSASSNTTSAQIVEPLISQAKTDDVNPNRVQPGDIVTFTVTTSNSGSSRVSVAHDTGISDAVPEGLIPVGPAPGNVPLAHEDEIPGSGGMIWYADFRTIEGGVATIAPGGSHSFSYRAEVEKPAVAGATLTNKVEAITASLDSEHSGRRTSGAGYEASAEDTIRLGGASVTKAVTPGEATPGESLSYTLKVTIPANVELFETTVVDRLPAGVEFDGYGTETCLSGCPLANPVQRYDFAPQGDGSALIAWDLGDIPALSQPQEIELTYDAYLRASERVSGDDVLAGDTEANTVTVSSNLTHKGGLFDPAKIPEEFDETSPEAEASVDVVEPELTLDKRIKVGSGSFGDGPTTAHSNDPLAYQLVISNEGSSPAYDVEVTDVLDPALTGVAVVPQAGVTVTEAWSSSTNSMAFLIDGPIAPGASVTIEYTAAFVAASELSDGQEVPNVASVPAGFGVPEADREANPGREYVEYFASPDRAEAVLDFPTLSLVKTTGLEGNPDSGNAEVNQPFPWRIVVTNSSATAGATAVEVADVLPNNWKYVLGSTEISNGSTADPSITVGGPGGDRLEWTVASLGPEASVTIEFEAKPLLAAATDPGTGVEAHVNGAAVASALDEGENSGNAAGPYSTPPDFAKATLVVPQLAVEKTPDDGSATAGTASAFTIEVENGGDGVARNVKVKDVLPAGLSYEAGTATATPPTGFAESSVSPGPGAGETTIEWTIDEIPGGSSVQIELPVRVGAAVADGATLTNNVAVTSDEETTPVEDQGSLEVETEADVAIEKTGAAGYTAGQSYTWSLRVQNHGPSQADDVRVTDPLPAETTFVSADAPCVHAAGEVTCDLGDLAPGFDQTYELTVEVDPGTTASPLSNTATVETTTEDPEPDNDESTFGPTAGALADVWIEKSAAPEAIDRKQQTTFTLTVGNDGPSVARNVELEDTLPAGLEFVSTDEPPCSQAAGTVTCAFGDMAPGAEETVQIVVKGVANGEHENTATVTTTTPEPEGHKPNTDEATVIVGPVADLALEKTGPATVAADGQLTWTLKATNNGEDPATGVEITDPLPAGTVFDSADPGCTLAAGTVTCAVGDLAVGESAERRITVTVPRALADTTVVNSATVSGDQADDEPGNDSDEATTKVGPSADLSVVKSGPARVNANGTVTWTLAIANAGPSTATAVSVKDTLPAGVSLLSVSSTQGSCTGAVECQLGTLPVGAAAQIQVVAKVPAALEGASLLNTATVSGAEPDPNPGNNESKATTVVDPPAPSDYDLAIAKSVDGSAKPKVGDQVSFELTVVNRGPATATAVKIVDTLPAALEFVKATVPGGKCTHKNGVVTCSVGSLAAGAEVRARVTARVLKQGSVKNTATVSAAVADADPSNDKSAATVNAKLAKTKLTIKKTRVGKGPVEAGDLVKYKIRVANRGSGPATGVLVCDRLPGKLSFAALSGAKLRGGDACWEIDLLPAGASKTFRLAARVDGGVSGGSVRNVAYVKSANAPRSQGVAGVRVEGAGPGRAGGVTG